MLLLLLDFRFIALDVPFKFLVSFHVLLLLLRFSKW